jgi:hypothetical protein
MDFSALYAATKLSSLESASSHQPENTVSPDFVGPSNTTGPYDLTALDGAKIDFNSSTADVHNLSIEATNDVVGISLASLLPDGLNDSLLTPINSDRESQIGYGVGHSGGSAGANPTQFINLSDSISPLAFHSVSVGQGVGSLPANTNAGDFLPSASLNFSIASTNFSLKIANFSPVGEQSSGWTFSSGSPVVNFNITNHSMQSNSALLGAGSTQTVSLSGSGLIFVNTYESSVSSAYMSAIITAENFYQKNFTNNVTIDLTFGTATGSFVAQSNAARDTTPVSYSELKTLLSSHATTADNQAAINSLPSVDPTKGAGFILTTALAEALGLSSFASSSTGSTINLNSGDSYFYNGVAVSGEYDAIGTLEHEISEVMGRIGGLGLNLGSGIYSDYWGPIDLFRYSAPGQRDYSGGADGKPAFFSINGTTLLTEFNNPFTTDPANPAQGGDVADWNVGGSSQVAVEVAGGYDSYGATPKGQVGVVTSTDLEVMNVLGWTPVGATSVTPSVVVNVQNASVAENKSIAASSMITSVSNPNGDNITYYSFWDGGTGNGHFTVNGAIQPDGQWIVVAANNLTSIQYVGGPQPGSETLYVDAYDATTGVYSNYSALTATTTAPQTQVVVNVQSVSVAENKSIAASSMITSVSNPNGDAITYYAFWDGGTGNGHLTVNGAIQPDGQWIVVAASNLSSIQYVGGSQPGSESIFVDAYDATTGVYSNYSTLTATTTAPQVAPVVNVQNVSVAENKSIAASSLITSVSNPNGDAITYDAFWDGGTGNGHFTVNGAIQPDGQWIVVAASNLSSIQYVGGTSPGSEALFVDIYDATTGTWSNYGSLTATTTAPHATAVVNVQNVSVAENASIAASSLITSVSNLSGDNITQYSFWDGGTGNGHFTVNGASQPDTQWIVVGASNLGSVQYVGGASAGSETLFVTCYDATTGTWSNYGSLTATTTTTTTTVTFPFTDAYDVTEAVYIGYFGRAGDQAGDSYWLNQLSSGSISETGMAASFSVQPESTALYPFLANAAPGSLETVTSTNGWSLSVSTNIYNFINSVYENLFNRSALSDSNSSGLNYWSSQLQANAGNPQAIATFILNVISGASGTDQTTIVNKVTVADYFTQALTSTGASFTVAANALAHSAITSVTSAVSTVMAAESTIDAFLSPESSLAEISLVGTPHTSAVSS